MVGKIEKIVFLDYKKYPNSDKALELLKETYPVICLDIAGELELVEAHLVNEDVYYFSLIPEYRELLGKLDLEHKSVLGFLNKEGINELKLYLQNNYSHLKVKRIKLSKEDVDPINLAELYKDSPSLSVKIQTTGLPMINRYKGMESFLSINELDSGLVTSATSHETEAVDSENVNNHDYIVQSIYGELHGLKVTERTSSNLTWYEVTREEVPSYIEEFLKSFGASSCYFIYLRSLKEFKVSAIFSGINYHVDPELYIN
jgi:hypothetical protein